MGIVYKLLSPSGKFYIGLTTSSITKRFHKHKAAWKLGSASIPLTEAFNEHDPSLWTIEILLESDDLEILNSKEIHYINSGLNDENCCNRRKGGVTWTNKKRPAKNINAMQKMHNKTIDIDLNT